jgi:hypothetical protein
LGVYGYQTQKAEQLRLDKQARLIEQMSGPIDEYLARAGMKRSILGFGFSHDGLCGSVTAENLRSTSGAEPDKLIAKEGRLHCYDRGGGDWWVQGEGPLRQVAFAMKGEHLARSETAAFRDVTAQYTLSEPYPVRTLTCASNGKEIQIPDLFAVLPLVRQMPEYKAWLKVRGVQTFFMTTRSDYRLEVYFMGRVRTSTGQAVDWIHDVVLFRPDRTRLASVALGNPEMILYDSSGEKVLAHINWTRALGDPGGVAEARVSSLEVNPNTADERVWKVDERAVIQDEALSFVMPPELEEILVEPAAKALGQMIEAVPGDRNEQIAVEGDLALVGCSGPEEMKGKWYAFYFVKTAEGWRNHSLRGMKDSTPLTKLMADFLKERPPVETAPAGPKASGQPQDTTHFDNKQMPVTIEALS